MFTYCFREPTNKQEDKRKRNEEIQEWLEEERYRFTSEKKGLKARNLHHEVILEIDQENPNSR